MSLTSSRYGWYTTIVLLLLLAGLLLAACSPEVAQPLMERGGSEAAPASRPSVDPAQALGEAGAASSEPLRLQIVGTLDRVGPQAFVVSGVDFALDPGARVSPALSPGQVVEVLSVRRGDGSFLALQVRAATQAQPPGLRFELIGVVESQSATEWVVGGHTIRVTAATEVEGRPVVGSRVKVQGTFDEDLALVAREIKLLADDELGDEDEIEFTGVVTLMGATEWVVAGQTVRVNAQTEIKPGIVLGGLVKVHANRQADGVLLAREIEPVVAQATGTPGAPGAEIEFTGTLTAIHGDVWTVNGFAVTVTASTEIKGDPQIGDLVKVHALRQADGSLVAREIEAVIRAPATPVPGQHRVEFRGVLTAVVGDTWTVNGITVIVSAATEIEGNPQVGDVVKVEGFLQADGSVLAREIEKEDELEEQGEIRFSGLVESISGTTWVIGGRTVRVNAQTRLESGLGVGVRAEVRGRLQADGSVLAERIKLDNSGPGSSGGGGEDDDDDDRSGSSGSGGGDHDDDDDDDRSGSGSGSSGSSGSGSSGSGSGGDDDDDDDRSGSSGSGSGSGSSGSGGGGDDDDDDDDD